MTIQKRLRDGASIARDRRINLDYATVATEAADRIDLLEELNSQLREQNDAVDAACADLEAANRDLVAGKFTDVAVSFASEYIGIEGGVAPLLIEMFAAQFKESHAENYLEMRFTSSQILPSEQFVVRVQKVAGKTPHALRLEAEQQRDEYRQAADEAAMKHKVERDELMNDKEVLLNHMATLRNVTKEPQVSLLTRLVIERMAQGGGK